MSVSDVCMINVTRLNRWLESACYGAHDYHRKGLPIHSYEGVEILDNAFTRTLANADGKEAFRRVPFGAVTATHRASRCVLCGRVYVVMCDAVCVHV